MRILPHPSLSQSVPSRLPLLPLLPPLLTLPRFQGQGNSLPRQPSPVPTPLRRLPAMTDRSEPGQVTSRAWKHETPPSFRREPEPERRQGGLSLPR